MAAARGNAASQGRNAFCNIAERQVSTRGTAEFSWISWAAAFLLCRLSESQGWLASRDMQWGQTDTLPVRRLKASLRRGTGSFPVPHVCLCLEGAGGALMKCQAENNCKHCTSHHMNGNPGSSGSFLGERTSGSTHATAMVVSSHG